MIKTIIRAARPSAGSSRVLDDLVQFAAPLHHGFNVYSSLSDCLTVLNAIEEARLPHFTPACSEYINTLSQWQHKRQQHQTSTGKSVTSLPSANSPSCTAKSSMTSDNTQQPIIIVVEGLDGVGKTTVTTRLAELTRATRLRTPAPLFETNGVRDFFRVLPEPLSRAFYCASNYYALLEMQESVQACSSNGGLSRDVFMLDRWYGSTCSMALAMNAVRRASEEKEKHATTNVNRDHHTTYASSSSATAETIAKTLACLPPPGHEIYMWPCDLSPLPSVSLLLDVPEHIRRLRAERRGNMQHEEVALAAQAPLRVAAMEVYQRLRVGIEEESEKGHDETGEQGKGSEAGTTSALFNLCSADTSPAIVNHCLNAIEAKLGAGGARLASLERYPQSLVDETAPY